MTSLFVNKMFDTCLNKPLFYTNFQLFEQLYHLKNQNRYFLRTFCIANIVRFDSLKAIIVQTFEN